MSNSGEEASEEVILNSNLEIERVLCHGGTAIVFPGWLENWTEEVKTRVITALSDTRENFRGFVLEVVDIERLWAGFVKVSGVMIVIRQRNQTLYSNRQGY